MRERNYDQTEIRFYPLLANEEIQIIHVDGAICAGFPSPADDYLQTQIDLKKELVTNPDATFMVRVQGDSMRSDGIEDGDVLIIDRSLTAKHGTIAVCYLNNQFTVKRLYKCGGKIRLMPANPDFEPIEVQEGDELVIWGVVTFIIKKPH